MIKYPLAFANKEEPLARIGYIRISSEQGQKTDRQDDAFASLNLDKIFTDHQSGKDQNRPALKEMLSYVREGDKLIVESISRISRSTRDLLSIIDSLALKKVAFVSIKENIDTATPQGKFVLTIFGALAELERESILQRQKEGIQSALARGKILGRPRANHPAEWQKYYQRWRNREITAKAAMDSLNLSRTTFYKLVKLWEKRVA